ncbi:MAG: methyltransferase domain-containing protein [Patescibacteria group bacterium]
MQSIDSKIYTKEYYLKVCLGSEEFKKTKGRELHPRLRQLLQTIPIPSDAKILDVGCGRGDISYYFANKGHLSIGIDYAEAAIDIAEKLKKISDPKVKKFLQFHQMDIKKLQLPDNYFDVVICIDVLEHLYKEEVPLALNEISRVLKKDGILFVHTGPNRLLYNFTYRWYILPMNKLLTKIDQVIKGKKYNPLPDDPRTPEEKIQHVNEPTYFYLKNLFKKYHFTGKLQIEIGFVKKGKGLRTTVYNALTTLYPLSRFTPINLLFGAIFIGVLRNNK